MAVMLHRMRLRWVHLLLLLILSSSALKMTARVVRIEVTSQADVQGGKTFGDAGAYERISGRVYFSLPVANPHNPPSWISRTPSTQSIAK